MNEKKCNVCGGVLLHDNTSGFSKHFLWSDCVKQLKSQLALAQEENKRYKLALEEARSEASDGRDGTVSWQMIYRLCDTALNGEKND